MIKYLISSVWFAYAYWVSGIGIEMFLKKGGLKQEGGTFGEPAYELIKERHRRKNMMLVISCAVVAAFTPLSTPWWAVTLCGLALWGIHFFGYWESFKMSLLRGVVESVAILPIMYFTGNWSILPLVYCVIAFGGANILSRLDPNCGGDWWWICSAWIGAWVGIAIACVL